MKTYFWANVQLKHKDTKAEKILALAVIIIAIIGYLFFLWEIMDKGNVLGELL